MRAAMAMPVFDSLTVYHRGLVSAGGLDLHACCTCKAFDPYAVALVRPEMDAKACSSRAKRAACIHIHYRHC
jgi:hypothetical protein